MNALNILGPSHIIIVCLSILSIIYFPKYFEKSSDNTKKIFSMIIIIFLLINQAMDFYREGIMSGRWQDGLPLHLCDFSTMAIILYFLTHKRDFFIFAFFFGIAGGGMSILTPDTIYGFPYVGYIQSQIGFKNVFTFFPNSNTSNNTKYHNKNGDHTKNSCSIRKSFDVNIITF